jgi:hypothetical protein
MQRKNKPLALPTVRCRDGGYVIELRFIGGPQDGHSQTNVLRDDGEPGLIEYWFHAPRLHPLGAHVIDGERCSGVLSHLYVSLDDYEPGVTATLAMEYAGCQLSPQEFGSKTGGQNKSRKDAR